jgi:hypothetical protein
MAVANGHLKILESLYHGRHLLRVDDRQGWMLAHSGSAAVDKSTSAAGKAVTSHRTPSRVLTHEPVKKILNSKH